MYRPQFPYPAAPAGFHWQPCAYQFDKNNVPAFAGIDLAAGAVSAHIPLKLDPGECFVLLGVKIQNGGVNVLLFDAWSNELMDDFVDPRLYASELQPFAQLEGPGIEQPAGSSFAVRLQGQ